MTKRLVKLAVIVLITIIGIQLFSMVSFVNADTIDPMDEINKMSEGTSDSPALSVLSNIGGTFITIFQIVGVGVALIMLIVLAMKYMLASAGDKADIKKHATVYIVGAVCLFAASGILGIIQNISKNFNG